MGSPFGIGVYVHATFLLLVAWFGLAALAAGQGLRGAGASVLFVGAVFLMVVLHELGHALVARRFGIRTRAITLLPIGGMASLERQPDRPGHELLVAVAGPMVNVVLAGALALLVLAVGGSLDPRVIISSDGQLLARLVWVNVMLALFNLVPGFPMDGGRILRALLAMRMGQLRATHVAAKVGKLVAVGFALLALTGNLILLMIAVFVWLGADAELRYARLRSSLAGARAGDAMITPVVPLTSERTLGDAGELLVHGHAHDFPVIDGGALRGVLTRDDLLRGLQLHGPDASVDVAMRRDVRAVPMAAPLEQALTALEAGGPGALVVLDGGAPVGVLTMEGVTAYLAVRSAVEQAHRPLRPSSAPT